MGGLTRAGPGAATAPVWAGVRAVPRSGVLMSDLMRNHIKWKLLAA